MWITPNHPRTAACADKITDSETKTRSLIEMAASLGRTPNNWDRRAASGTPQRHDIVNLRTSEARFCSLLRRICARPNLTLLFPNRMARSFIAPLFLFFASSSALWIPRAAAQINEGSTYGPLPVFEFHSGFWVNLHHTLYQEAKFGASQDSSTAADNDKAPGKNRPTLKTSPGAKSPLTPAEQRAWNEALSYYAANYIDKDLLFTTELILIKNQLGDFDGCDELSGRKKRNLQRGPARKSHARTGRRRASLSRASMDWPRSGQSPLGDACRASCARTGAGSLAAARGYLSNEVAQG